MPEGLFFYGQTHGAKGYGGVEAVKPGGSRRKGARGVLEAKKLLETLYPESTIEIVHSARGDLRGGDLLLDNIPIQVKYGAHVPKKLYQFTEKCDLVLARRVSRKEPGLSWIRIERAS